MGPTAAGKTAVAVALAQAFKVRLISVDSMLVYRDLNIGTAKPDAVTLGLAPHALIDIRAFWQGYSAAEFCHDAHVEICTAHAQGAMPMLVGGTGLYFRALAQGLSALPPADAAIRAALHDELTRQGLAAMHARLTRLDPIAATRIDVNDPQRTLRALEVIALTGQPFSAQLGARAKPRLTIHKFIVNPDSRVQLHAQIAARTERMFADGLVDEVKTTMQHVEFKLDLSAARAVGYRQVIEHLDGQFDLEECRRRVLYATRQYAKRQLTWLRAEADALWLLPEDAASQIAKRVALPALTP